MLVLDRVTDSPKLLSLSLSLSCLSAKILIGPRFEEDTCNSTSAPSSVAEIDGA